MSHTFLFRRKCLGYNAAHRFTYFVYYNNQGDSVFVADTRHGAVVELAVPGALDTHGGAARVRRTYGAGTYSRLRVLCGI